jgi:hypothetical protein
MRVPHVSDRIKEAPAVALRGVLAGVGQLLLITDKLRNKTPADDVPQARAPEASENIPQPAPPAATQTATRAEPEAPEQRDLDKTGNVRLLSEQTADAGDAPPPAEDEDAAVSAEAEIQAATPRTPGPAESAPGAPATAEATGSGQGDLPLPNYDELSVASLRARLRTLTAAQVTALAEYERSHAARPEVVTMFERRIAKLEAGG